MDSYITEKLEEGYLNYFASSSLSSSISHFYKSNNSAEDKESPCLIVQCGQAEEDFLGSGVYHIDTRIYLIQPFEDSGSVTNKNKTINEFNKVLYNNQNIINDITGSTTNVNIYDIMGKGMTNTIQDNHWVLETALDTISVYTE